jgi:hypothetical protein
VGRRIEISATVSEAVANAFENAKPSPSLIVLGRRYFGSGKVEIALRTWTSLDRGGRI